MDLSELLAAQSGVVSRRQLLDFDLTPHDVARMLRRRELARVHPGVYVDHTGPLAWDQRAWAAVLAVWPAALSHQSAVADGDPGPIHVPVSRDRHLSAPSGVRLHRVTDLDDRVQWNRSPPRVRLEEATIDLAIESDSELDAVGWVSRAVGGRRTTSGRLLETLRGRRRAARRAWLERLLVDVGSGACSVLEEAYLTRVVRPRGLPEGRRQASHRHLEGQSHRDVEHAELGVVVELDGRVFHESVAARDRDMERDLDAAVEESITLRLSYGQVLDRGCATAVKVAAVLRSRGWTGEPTSCEQCGGSDPPGGPDPPH